MNSRERVVKAVNHEIPDRVPIDLGGLRASGINAVVYDKLKKLYGVHTPTKIHDIMQILADVEPLMLEKLHIDVVPLDPASADWGPRMACEGVMKRLFAGTDVYFPPGTRITEKTDGSWELWNNTRPYAQMPENGYYFDFLSRANSDLEIDPDQYHPRDTLTDDELEIFARRAKHLYENTDKAILGWGAGLSLIGLSAILTDSISQGSLDQWMIMMMTEKETAQEMMGRCTDATLKLLKLYHEAVGDRCFAWGVGSDDAGTQIAEFLRPEFFAEMIIPHYKQVCDWVHQHTGWKTFLHSCGSIYNLIPYWIDAGIDILNPVQISAANMEPERLMEAYAGKIVFWGGGCNTQGVLATASPEAIRNHVRENIDIFTRQRTAGGFVFTQVHNIQQNVPAENVRAMFSAAYEFGSYLPVVQTS